jgi:hypothetical protein
VGRESNILSGIIAEPVGQFLVAIHRFEQRSNVLIVAIYERYDLIDSRFMRGASETI